MYGKSQLEAVGVELTVILGRCTLPMHQLLRMGRGAVIPLNANERDPVWILANGFPIARGEISIQGERIAVTVLEPADHLDYLA